MYIFEITRKHFHQLREEILKRKSETSNAFMLLTFKKERKREKKTHTHTSECKLYLSIDIVGY